MALLSNLTAKTILQHLYKDRDYFKEVNNIIIYDNPTLNMMFKVTKTKVSNITITIYDDL